MTASDKHGTDTWLDPDPESPEIRARVRRVWEKLHGHTAPADASLAALVPAVGTPEMEQFADALAKVLEEEHDESEDDSLSYAEIREAFLASAREDTPDMLNDTIRGLRAPEDLDFDVPTVPLGSRTFVQRTFIRSATPVEMADGTHEKTTFKDYKRLKRAWERMRRSALDSVSTSMADRFLASAYETVPEPSLSARITQFLRSVSPWKLTRELAIIDRNSFDPTKGKVHFWSDNHHWDLSYHRHGNTLLVIVAGDTTERKVIRAVIEVANARTFSRDMLQVFGEDPVSTKDAIKTLRQAIAGDHAEADSFAGP
ncbi:MULTISPECIES: hypothetical protein [unclassified Paraburkholderia]|uniref:hypothetical protein n=1 Tax=unclassified Paraburkholderia TaxID=2615204 RepID=UPI002AB29ABE|nr:MULTISPECIES: hypothetical protein [unclassified Paraburkholderia]